MDYNIGRSFFSPFGFNSFFPSVFMIFFVLIFVIVIGLFIYVIISGVSTWNKNNHSPVLTVDSTVVAKRNDVSSYHHMNSSNQTHFNHTTHSSTYYVTFQVESGDRMEFVVHDNEYGMLVEGDFGKLTFQGTRYISFHRNLSRGQKEYQG